MKTYPTKKLGDNSILLMTSGGTPIRSNLKYYNGDILWLKSGELNDNQQINDSEEKITEDAIKNSSAKIFPTNTVLLAMYGATAGKLGILNRPATTNQAIAGMTCNENNLFNKFLYYFLLNIREDIISKAWGGAQPNLSQTIIKNIEIPLPPLSEQKKIVAKLERVLAKIGEAKKLRAVARENTGNLLSAELHKIFSEGKKKGWEEKKVEDVTTKITKGTTPKTLGFQLTQTGVPFLRAENIDGEVNAEAVRLFMSKETNNALERSKTQNGDVLITIAGTIGRIGWIPQGAPEMNMNQAVAIIRPKSNFISTKYLVYALRGRTMQDQVSAGTVKAAIPNFSLTMIRGMIIPLPPLAEQKKIVARLDSLSEKIEKIKNLQSQTAADFKTLEQSVLRQAFSN